MDGLNSPDLIEFYAVPGEPGEQLVAASSDEAAAVGSGRHQLRPHGYVTSDTNPKGHGMATKLNDSAYRHAQNLIKEGHYVLDQRDDWSEHQPSAGTENSFIEEHGWNEYQKWFLAVDEEEAEETKARYKFPYGDFENVHRCGVISAESRAGQYHYYDVERSAQHLLSMLNELTRTGARRA